MVTHLLPLPVVKQAIHHHHRHHHHTALEVGPEVPRATDSKAMDRPRCPMVLNIAQKPRM